MTSRRCFHELVTAGEVAIDPGLLVENDAPRDAPEPCVRSVLVWRRERSVLHRTIDADEAELAPLLARGTSLAEVSERLVALADVDPERRMVELLARWLDAEVLVR